MAASGDEPEAIPLENLSPAVDTTEDSETSDEESDNEVPACQRRTEPEKPRHWYTLPVIVFAQFAGTSLWFAGNAVIPDLQEQEGFTEASTGYSTSLVQFGFIVGTLCFAAFSVADYFSARMLFLVCSLFGAAANLGMLFASEGLAVVLIFRFITGFFLAGVYPVGMRLAASWFPKEVLGRAIGWLVGALVLGTAFPHLLKTVEVVPDWRAVIASISVLAAIGGVVLSACVPDGPLLGRKRAAGFQPKALLSMFNHPPFRASAFGYFGHMWELYSLWAFTPWLLDAYKEYHNISLNTSAWSFGIIAVGALACGLGGMASLRVGSAVVATSFLGVSGLCCLLVPLAFEAPTWLFLAFMFVWGACGPGDSPQFSSLSASSAPREMVGSALTIVTCIGFSITIASIELMNAITDVVDPHYALMPLVIGPAMGLMSTWPLVRKTQEITDADAAASSQEELENGAMPMQQQQQPAVTIIRVSAE